MLLSTKHAATRLRARACSSAVQTAGSATIHTLATRVVASFAHDAHDAHAADGTYLGRGCLPLPTLRTPATHARAFASSLAPSTRGAHAATPHPSMLAGHATSGQQCRHFTQSP